MDWYGFGARLRRTARLVLPAALTGAATAAGARMVELLSAWLTTK